jgi:hypothetical protein
MAITDDFRAVVAHLRGWGFKVVEWDGCYGRSNGGGWAAGRPVGHINHHFVCSMNPSQSYINGLVSNLANGKTVNWFADVHGVAYLIGTGPMNHAGTGNQSVLDLTRSDRPPPGPSNSSGNITGNAHYSGTECQHPGDSTPWPDPMLRIMVAINAAEFLVWGYSANRAIDHYEWTGRKIDMSAGGGRSSNWAGDELRRRVSQQMTGGSTPTPPEPEIDMASTASVLIDGNPNVFAVASDGKIYQRWPDPNQEGGWSGWSAGVPGDWAGGLSVVANPLPQLWGVASDGKTVQTVWSSGDRWNGPVAWTGIEAKA